MPTFFSRTVKKQGEMVVYISIKKDEHNMMKMMYYDRWCVHKYLFSYCFDSLCRFFKQRSRGAIRLLEQLYLNLLQVLDPLRIC